MRKIMKMNYGTLKKELGISIKIVFIILQFNNLISVKQYKLIHLASFGPDQCPLGVAPNV